MTAMRRKLETQWPLRHTPVALAIAMLGSLAMAQPAPNTTSADVPDAKSLFETGGQAGIGPRPFNSFLDRISSPVGKILLEVAGDNLPADGVNATEVRVRLLDSKAQPVTSDVDVTIEASGGARVWLPGRSTSESGADKGDIDRIQPGVQATAKGGVLEFKLIAPYKPDAVTLRISVRGVAEKVIVRYVPDLREMLVVGMVEGRLRSDKFNPSEIQAAQTNDGFDNELRSFTREFNGGATQFGARAAMYLKGKIQGQYLLTMAYDSDKDTRSQLFQTVDPNAFYPVYGDGSIRSVDAQSSGKLYVRIDKNRSYLLYGDYTTADTNPARSLSNYSRSLPGLRGHYEEGRVIANTFVAQQSYNQVVDEFPARGVSGPYSVSNPNGVKGSEKVEILVRDRNRPTNIVSATLLAASSDYEFEPFSGQIVFRAPVPSYDDQLNPVSIRVTYEVDQGGAKFFVYGGDVRLKISDTITVGASAVKDENPSAPFQVQGVNVQLKLSKATEFIAEIAHTESVVNTTAFNVNTSNNFAGKSGDMVGNAERFELRHSDDAIRARVYGVHTDDDFNNNSAGITGGKTEYGATAAYKVNSALTLNGEITKANDNINATNSTAMSIGADLKMSDRLTMGAGIRRVQQNALNLTTLTASNCSSQTSTATTSNTSTGYNTGFGINQQGNQNIDPATGQPIVCAPTVLGTTTAPTSIDASSMYARMSWKATDRVTLTGEVQKEVNTDSSLLYKLGADWRVADKTRLYARYENSQLYTGVYGLGTGTASNAFTLGIDTQYMKDGSLYSEYRLRDTGSGKDIESAIGLRNGWVVAEGLRLTTNVEHVVSATADASTLGSTTQTGANTIGLGLEYTANPLWKASGRIERREDNTNGNWLTTLSAARKLDRDWTFVARDYLTLVQPLAGDADSRQHRMQLGFAYRPVDNNRFDALGLYEYKTQDDGQGNYTGSDIITTRVNYHPSRPWFVSGRFAIKRVNELLLGTVSDTYTAALVGGRVTYDITNRWSLGAISTVLVGQGGGKQYGYGLEVGYTLVDNLLVTVGYNWRGFVGGDLAGSDYTNRGWVLGMRYKFDESLFGKDNPNVNKTLNPNVAPAKP